MPQPQRRGDPTHVQRDVSDGTEVEQKLNAALAERGRLTFAEFQELVLHGPGGYYESDSAVVGASGDFYTSPELHPAFGGLVAEQAYAIWLALGGPSSFPIVEYGGGSGALARDLLTWVRKARPEFAPAIRYRLVERSERLVRRQRETLEAAGFGAPDVEWRHRSALDAEGSEPAALIVAHELLDAFPFHLVRGDVDRLVERFVVQDAGGWVLRDGEPSTPALQDYLHDAGVRLAPGGQAEINLSAVQWLEMVASELDLAAILIVDYGADTHTLFEMARPHGTLRCYFQHTVNDRPFERLGRQDITADVDFGTLGRIARKHGFQVWGPLPQHQILEGLGVDQLLRQLARAPLTVGALDANRRAIRELSEVSGLGRVQWLLATRGIAAFTPFRRAAAPPSAYLPLLGAEQMRLPAAESLESLGDFSQLWHDYWSGEEDDVEGNDEPVAG